jgi:hypothetical protein
MRGGSRHGSKAGHDLIADMYGWQVQAAAEYLIETEQFIKKIRVMRERHKLPETAPLACIVEEAAISGDKEAISVLVSGFLERRNPYDEARRIVTRLRAASDNSRLPGADIDREPKAHSARRPVPTARATGQ